MWMIGRAAFVAAFVAALVTAAPLAAQVTQPTDSARPRDSVQRRDSIVMPVADQARGIDSEIRVALYDLLGERAIPALSRLQWLNSSPSVFSTPAAQQQAYRGREDLLFLLAQSYYRLGMTDAFRATAEPVVRGPSGARYASVLHAQLLLDAYRRGEYARAVEMAKALGATETRGLAALVSGLAAYQTGAFAESRASFAMAQQAGPPYAGYAQYMDALAQLRADTSQKTAALAALQTVAGGASGEFREQVRLTAAQLAYESGRYDEAVSLVDAISPTSGLAAQAHLTKAWALFKGNKIAEAGNAFAEFGTRYPDLPERDEARLMSAQVALQLNRTAEAARIFAAVADSANAEVTVLQSDARGALTESARAIVAARAAGILFITDPANGKTIALQDAAGGDVAALLRVVADTVMTTGATVPQLSSLQIVTLTDLMARVNAASGLSGLPRRILFTRASASSNRGEYMQRAQALYSADVAVAVARYRLQERLDQQAAHLAMLQATQARIEAENASLATLATQLQAAQDSLARLALRLDARGTEIRQFFGAQIEATRLLSAENTALIDSVRRRMGPGLGAMENELLSIEAQTSATYRRIADEIDAGLNGALARHPTLALRDSVRVRADRMRTLFAETQGLGNSTRDLMAAEVARTQREGPAGANEMRAALSAAESQRASVESQLIALVERELNARNGAMIAALRHDTEAADFGSASALFFQALEAGGSPGTNEPPRGTSGGAGSAASPRGEQTAPGAPTNSGSNR